MPNAILNKRCAGNPYPNIAANFVAASSQSATIADNADMSAGNTEFTFAGWVNPTSVAANQTVFSKYGASGSREYLLWIPAASTFRFQVSVGGAGSTTSNSTTYGNAVAGAWQFVVASYDQANVKISVNGGAFNNTAQTGAAFDSTQQFGFATNDAGTGFGAGSADSWGFWKTAPAGGGALTLAQITKLYKGGVGMAYRDLDSDLKTGLVSWWNFDGTLNDSHGTNHLTNNNGVSFTGGKR